MALKKQMIFRKGRDHETSTLLIEIRKQLLIFSRKKKKFDREARIKIENQQPLQTTSGGLIPVFFSYFNVC